MAEETHNSEISQQFQCSLKEQGNKKYLGGFMKRRIIRNAMAVFVVLTMLISVASAADAVVSIGNASVNKTGDTAIVKIKIDDVSNMGSANIVLKYNNNIVMVDNVSEGDLGELALNISNAEGTTTIQWTGFEGKNGSFELAHEIGRAHV